MFADMGIQPTTLEASLILATQSTDTTKPIVDDHVADRRRAASSKGRRSRSPAPLRISAAASSPASRSRPTAARAGGRRRAARTGATAGTCRPAAPTRSWSRAVDDSVNLGDAPAGVQVTVNLPSTSSLWTLASKPAVETTLDRDAVDTRRQVPGVARAALSTASASTRVSTISATHVVDLWTSTGTLLASGVSVGESHLRLADGVCSRPRCISTAGTTYVASYHNNGYWSATTIISPSTYTNGPLTVLAGGGVYAYTRQHRRCSRPIAGGNQNYWVDVVFNPDPNQAPTAVDDSGFSVGKNGTLAISFAALVGQRHRSERRRAYHHARSATRRTEPSRSTRRRAMSSSRRTAGYSGPASFSYTVSDGRGGTGYGQCRP